MKWQIASLLLLAASVSAKQRYDGYQAFKVQAPTLNDLQFLQDMAAPIKFNIWDFKKGRDGSAIALFHVHPELVLETLNQLAARQLSYEVISYDLQKDIDAESVRNVDARDDSLFDHYYTYDELQQFLTDQANLCGSNCSVIQIGTSFEGRALNIMKMVGEPKADCQQKPSIWIDAGIHAREWIAVSTAQYLINSLIEDYATDSFVKEIRDTYDWYIHPSVNPDGYAYSWESDRLWRKTRQVYDGQICIGADANRNYDFQWSTVGASDNPCDDTYCGPYPHSEPETLAQSDYMLALNGVWDLFVTLHSYGQLWMSPWGYQYQLPDNFDDLEQAGLAAVQAIFDTHGETYEFGAASQILYLSSGTSRDWAAGVPLIPFVYTIELRDENGFVLPPSEILPTGEEIWAGLKAAVQEIRQMLPRDCVTPAVKN